MFLSASVLILGGWKSLPWFPLDASVFVWERLDAIAVMLLLVTGLLRVGFRIIPGVFLQVVVLACDRPGSILGIVFAASALVCGELPLEVFWKVSVLVLGGPSKTSGALKTVVRGADVGVTVAGLTTAV